MPLPILAALGPLLGMGKTWLEGRNARKQAKLSSDLALNQAKTEGMIKRMEQGQVADIAWENLSISNNGWKDEFWTLVIAIPLVGCFIPGGAELVRAGFEALNSSTPEWYQWAVLISIGSAFGVRRITEFMKAKKGA